MGLREYILPYVLAGGLYLSGCAGTASQCPVKENGLDKRANVVQIVQFEGMVHKILIPIQNYFRYKELPHPDDKLKRLGDYFFPSDPTLEMILNETLELPTRSREDDAQKILDFVHKFVYVEDVDRYIKTPLETIIEGGGDCEDLSVLGYTLMKMRKLDVVFIKTPSINGDKSTHVLLGVAGDFKGKYITHNGKRYYTAETTGTKWPHRSAKWKIGQLSRKRWRLRKKFEIIE